MSSHFLHPFQPRNGTEMGRLVGIEMEPLIAVSRSEIRGGGHGR